MAGHNRTPPTWTLFLMILLPVAAHYYPEVFDWRFAAIAVPACAAGAVIVRKLAALHRSPDAGAPVFARPWFAIWAGYATAIAAPGLLFRAFFGPNALPVRWALFWPGGNFALDRGVTILTNGLLLATVPAVLVALLAPARQRSRVRAVQHPDSSTPPEVRANGLLRVLLVGLGPLVVFAAAAFALSLRIPSGNVPALRVDAMLNVWNQWWFKKALFDPGLSITHTDYIFQPYGVSLLWHTLGPLNCVIGIAYQAISGADAIGAYNFVALMSFALMGWAGYLLGRRLGCPSVGFFVGFAIMLCGAHLGQVREGHLGLANAQWVIFFLLFILRTFERGRAADAVIAGVFWSAAFYTHFYHAIFCGIAFGIMALAAASNAAATSPRIRAAAGSIRSALGRRWVLPVLISLSALTFWGSGRWMFWVIFCWIAVVAAMARPITAAFSPGKWWRAAIAPLIFAAAAGPWLVPMFLQNAHHGGALDWGRPSNFFAMDLLGYIVPSPVSRGSSLFEFVWGRFLIPAGDSSAFLGAPVIALAIYGLLRNRKPYWNFMAAAFVAISLGPKLHILGESLTGQRLPYRALDAVPFLAASGVAGRYSLPATVSIVMIAAAGLAHLLKRSGRNRSLIGAVAVISVLTLSYPRMFLYDPPRPKLLQLIKEDPAEGNVLPLCPVDTAMWFQTIHEKKMIHGFASRVPLAAKNFIGGEPVFREIRYGHDLKVPREDALSTLRSFDVRWIIVAEGRPRRTLEDGLGLRPAAAEGDVYLYRVE